MGSWGQIYGKQLGFKVFMDAHGTVTAEVGGPKYFCASVERIDFTPIEFEVVNKIFKDRGL